MKQKVLRLVALVAPMFVTSTAFAQEAAAAASNQYDVSMFARLAAGIGIGIAAAGGGIGQGRASAAALEGIARNPNASGKILVPMILGLALIESLVIYALVIAFQLAG